MSDERDLSADPELMAAFLDETQESLSSLDALFIALERDGGARETLEAIFRPVHSFKGNAAFFGLLEAKRLAHELETVLDHLRKGRARIDRGLTDLLLAGVDALKGVIAGLRAGGPEIADPAAHRVLLQALGAAAAGATQGPPDWDGAVRDLQLLESLVPGDGEGAEAVRRLLALVQACRGRDSATTQVQVHAPGPDQGALEPRPGAGSTARRQEESGRSERGSERFARDGSKTMRVSEASIDTFLHYVGELVVVGGLFDHLRRRLAALPGAAPLARDFRRAGDTFSGLSNQLQRSIMAIRRVPLRPLLQKVPRLVRDVAQARGKDIAVELRGEEIEVDKALIELLDAPLAHLVRNAADHGIEEPARRRAAGKPATGTISIAVVEGERDLTLTIADDGAGLDLAAIRRKGEQNGLIQPGQPLGEQELVALIFASGVSTAAQVTDISGRGVGLDVVKRAVEDAGGAIQVGTEPGKGTRFQVRLPKGVSTQIITGYLVRAHGHAFVLPLDRVRETFKVLPADLSAIAGGGRVVRRGEQVLPLLSLPRVFGSSAEVVPAAGGPVVVAMVRRRELALAVDAVLGVQKVVLRPLQGLPEEGLLFTAGALLGDGTVALVLDLDRLQPGMD